MLKYYTTLISIFLLKVIFSQSDTTKLDSVMVVPVPPDTLHLHLQKLIQEAENTLQVKNYRSAIDLFSAARRFNSEHLKDSLAEVKMNSRIGEINLILACFQKLETAKALFDSKKYYEVLPLVTGCEQYDTIRLLDQTKVQIKIIEDSILFESYIQQIKLETNNKEYKKSLEIIEKAKVLKTNSYLDSIEAATKQTVAFIAEKNLKRFNDYKKIADDLRAYAIKSDTLSIKLKTIKEYYHNKYDTCIGYLRSTYKEFYGKVRAHEDFDQLKDEFKLTDYWDEKDEDVFKVLEELKAKTDYQFRFINRIEQVIQQDDDRALRNFKKYVYIKDIIYVFLMP